MQCNVEFGYQLSICSGTKEREVLWRNIYGSWYDTDRIENDESYSTYTLKCVFAALPIITLNISPYANVTLTLRWTTLFMGDMSEGALHEEERK
jgi:hypothetical protein